LQNRGDHSAQANVLITPNQSTYSDLSSQERKLFEGGKILWWRKGYLDLLEPCGRLVHLLRLRLPAIDGDHLRSSLLNQTSCVPLPLETA
jgi:hypothetical protein